MTGGKSRALAIIAVVVGMLFTTASPATASPLVYHGGAVVRNPQVRVIFWGSNWNQNAGAREQIQGLFSSLSGSNYQGILTQYYDTGGFISPNVGVDSWTDQSIAAPNDVSWQHIEEEIQYAAGQRGWSGGINNVYMVFPAPGSKYHAGFVLGCGSHYFASSLGSPMAYVGWPGDEPFKTCASYDPGNQNRAWAAASVVASHEYAEGVTDPVTKKYAGTFTGWITDEPNEDEIADKCSMGGMAGGFYVNYLWDNSIGGCTLSHPPSPPPGPTPTMAFQANNGQLFSMSGLGGSNWGQGMKAGTSPSITGLHTGGYQMAFQANNSQLVSIGTAGGTNWGQGMAAGTSPSIGALAGSGYEMAFQSNAGQLVSVGTAGNTNWGQGMWGGTSPSIAGLSGGGYEMAFQANTSNLITMGSAGNTNWGLGMMKNTSPSIAGMANNGFQVAFQANTGNVWSVGSAGTSIWGLGMMAGTSPAIAALTTGGYQIAFQSNAGQLWTVGTAGSFNLGQGMKGGTSPSITALPGGGYEIAFQANNSQLVSIGTAGGTNWGQGMAAGTSPSITLAH